MNFGDFDMLTVNSRYLYSPIFNAFAELCLVEFPPVKNCMHPRENEKCVQFFFFHECFGAIIPFEKPKIKSPSHLNWINLQRDKHENWMKKSS